eukprot:CAMPEP_0174721392 /NCGR_PEP_ID=MMETSP1094-20130205/36092_1 /TAXON_ID=156173 /ORGANISM="Chrysochromulina brevifilum, Strain UTEX LB 985" /LENGTH=54 /DNA_ID=CAMNT_0015922069 /DNA_START=144 /DNA_END=308 /DNA_ORIENTATION=-
MAKRALFASLPFSFSAMVSSIRLAAARKKAFIVSCAAASKVGHALGHLSAHDTC